VCQEFYTHIAPHLEPLSAELHIRDYAYPGQVIIYVINVPLYIINKELSAELYMRDYPYPGQVNTNHSTHYK
jgi:hypothetical protein